MPGGARPVKAVLGPSQAFAHADAPDLSLPSPFLAALRVPMIVTRNIAGWPFQAFTIVGLLWLCPCIRGCKRENAPSAWYVPEGIEVRTAAVAVGDPPSALGLVYGGLMFRSLYWAQRSVRAMLLLYPGALYGAVALSLLLTGTSQPLIAALPHLFGLSLMSAILGILATVLDDTSRAWPKREL